MHSCTHSLQCPAAPTSYPTSFPTSYQWCASERKDVTAERCHHMLLGAHLSLPFCHPGSMSDSPLFGHSRDTIGMYSRPRQLGQAGRGLGSRLANGGASEVAIGAGWGGGMCARRWKWGWVGSWWGRGIAWDTQSRHTRARGRRLCTHMLRSDSRVFPSTVQVAHVSNSNHLTPSVIGLSLSPARDGRCDWCGGPGGAGGAAPGRRRRR